MYLTLPGDQNSSNVFYIILTDIPLHELTHYVMNGKRLIG